MNKRNNKEQMRLLWDKDKNKQVHNKSFEEVSCKDNKIKAYWICHFEGRMCSFTKTPKQVYQALYHGSPVCSVCKELPYEKSIAFEAPDRVNKYWNFNKNVKNGVFPEYTPSRSNDKVYVKCDMHNWGIDEGKFQRCADLAVHVPCPLCSKKLASPEYNLQMLFPVIANELHPNFSPTLILPFTAKVYPWWCKECEDFYSKAVKCRTSLNQGCPNHKHHSTTEDLLLLMLNNIVGGFKKHSLKGISWNSNGGAVEVDIYNPKLKLAVEYDGYQHDSINRKLSDQEKNRMLNGHNGISLFIRIRERGLPNLEYFPNQYVVICEKHNYTYKFLIPAIQQAIMIINKNIGLGLKEYSEHELVDFIRELLPKARGSYFSTRGKETFAEYAPGLLRHLDSEDRKPYTVTKGSKCIFKNVSCPDCGYVFSNHKSTARILIKSQGLCKNCGLLVEDIHKIGSPLIKWYPKVAYEKSLEANDPIMAKFYSKKNHVLASEVAYKGSEHQTIWDCPFCFDEYISTNYKQVTNGCKCTECGKKALEITMEEMDQSHGKIKGEYE